MFQPQLPNYQDAYMQYTTPAQIAQPQADPRKRTL
jgi:hypothetical protein